MIKRKYTLVNSNDNFNQKRYYFLDNYPCTIHLFLIGDWYKVYNKDAEIISAIFDYKLFDDNYSPYLGNICCGFPKRIISKIITTLNKYEINYNIVDIENNCYELYDFESKNYYNSYIEKNINYNKDNSNYIENKNSEDEELDNYNSKKSQKTIRKINRYTSKNIEIGDTVIIKNLVSGKHEKYTIVKTYYNSKPVGVSKSKWSFGAIIYEDELISDNNVDAGEILSESEFAKSLLGLHENDIVVLMDEDLNKCKYQVISIIKNKNN